MDESWYKNFKKEASETSGLVGGLGVVTAGISAYFLVPAFVVGGGVVALASLGYAGIKAIPQKKKLVNEFIGKKVSIEELSEIEKLLKVGLLGQSKVGKTTLINKMNVLGIPTSRTDELYASIQRILDTDYCVALVDGAGQEYVQQFKIIEQVDLVILLLDHNTLDSKTISERRLRDQKEFVNQVRDHINHNRLEKRIHILFNKSDKWYNDVNKRQQILDILNEYKSDFAANPLIKVTSDIHTNFEDEEIRKVWTIIKNEVIYD